MLDQKLATGDAVNVAARLEQAARPGEVLLGEATCRLVAERGGRRAARRRRGEGEEPAARRLEVLGLRPDVPPSRALAGAVIGRGRELARSGRFRDAVEAVVPLATIVGPPGIGKSRLTRELVRSLEQRARVVVGRCVAYGDGITYLPLSDIVHDVAGADPEPALCRS